MITLSICWGAIGIIFAIILATVAFTFAVMGLAELCSSDERWKKILGWTILSTILAGLLVVYYFHLAGQICG